MKIATFNYSVITIQNTLANHLFHSYFLFTKLKYTLISRELCVKSKFFNIERIKELHFLETEGYIAGKGVENREGFVLSRSEKIRMLYCVLAAAERILLFSFLPEYAT